VLCSYPTRHIYSFVCNALILKYPFVADFDGSGVSTPLFLESSIIKLSCSYPESCSYIFTTYSAINTNTNACIKFKMDPLFSVTKFGGFSMLFFICKHISSNLAHLLQVKKTSFNYLSRDMHDCK